MTARATTHAVRAAAADSLATVVASSYAIVSIAFSPCFTEPERGNGNRRTQWPRSILRRGAVVIGVSAALVSPQLVLASPGIVGAAQAATTCTYPRITSYQLPSPWFYGKAQDGDYIGSIDDGYERKPTAGQIAVRLQAGSGVTWWKQFQIYDCRGNLLAQDWTQDSKRTTVWHIFDTAQISGGSIVLWKAKAFGIHTAMYQMQHIEGWDGRSVEVLWGDD